MTACATYDTAFPLSSGCSMTANRCQGGIFADRVLVDSYSAFCPACCMWRAAASHSASTQDAVRVHARTAMTCIGVHLQWAS